MLFHRRLLLLGTILIAPLNYAQTRPPALSPTFDIVSIKPAKPNTIGSSLGFHNESFTATNITLNQIIQEAYGIPGSQIIGIPHSLSRTTFDIEAKSDPLLYQQEKSLTRGQDSDIQKQMVQQLLADQFKLAVHSETRELPIYVLIVAKGGPKLQAAKDASAGPHVTLRRGQLEAEGVTTADLVKSLTRAFSNGLGRIVVDQTNLAGTYDLVLNWTPDSASSPTTNAEPDTSAPSIFTAIQEQLGLELESTKGPVPVLVVVHAERPSEN